MKIDSSIYQQSLSPSNTQLPYWEESLPLPEFPPNTEVVVKPSQVVPVKVKEKQKVVKLPVVSPPAKHPIAAHVHHPIRFFVVAIVVLPFFFGGSFLLARFLLEKGGKGVIPIPTLLPLSSPSQEVSILLPWRISSAIIPLSPSKIPADLTKNWDSYVNPTLRFSFKYPKEWFLTEFGDSGSSVVKLSYPVRSNQIGSFAAGEKAYVLVSWEEKRGATLESILSTKYNFSIIKKEEIQISGKRGWRLYNPEGKGEIVAFLEHGQKIISIEAGVKNKEELSIYQDLFILIQNTFVFS